MRRGMRRSRSAFQFLWAVGLGCVTLLLLVAPGGSTGSLSYYAKVAGVGVLWIAFLGYAAKEGVRWTRWSIIPRRFDKGALFVVLALILFVLLIQELRLILGLRVFPALLLGLVCAGMFQILHDMMSSRRR